jgi:alkylation response protein AidB-like acyl-CoA dehydrogenase
VFLDEVRIPAANVVGDVGEGWRVAQTTLASERSAIAGGSGGADPPGLIAMAQQLGRSEDPLVRQAVVEAHLRGELLRFLRLRAQTALSQGTRPGAEASVMKLAYARFMQQMTATALHVQGPLGMLTDPGITPRGGVWTTKFLHSPSLRIAGGSDQIQGNIIGERVLGLPAEARPDRDTPFRELGKAVR